MHRGGNTELTITQLLKFTEVINKESKNDDYSGNRGEISSNYSFINVGNRQIISKVDKLRKSGKPFYLKLATGSQSAKWFPLGSKSMYGQGKAHTFYSTLCYTNL